MVQPSGKVAFLPPGVRVDEEFSQLATRRTATVQFRYGSRCVKSACAHWQGQRCAALDEVRAHLAPFAQTSSSSCSIQPQCRWHQQAGDAACAVCPLVITEMMAVEEEETPRPCTPGCVVVTDWGVSTEIPAIPLSPAGRPA